MLILPFDAENDIRRVPFVTLVITFVCIYIFIRQEYDDNAYAKGYEKFCREMQESNKWLTLRQLGKPGDAASCQKIMSRISRAENKQAEMMALAKGTRLTYIFEDSQYEIQYTYEALAEEYARFQKEVPASSRDAWTFHPLHYTMSQFFTASISHNDICHLVGNIIFFLVFACTLELVIGHISIFLFFIFAAFISHLGYSYSVYIGFNNDRPSLGLSGVISAAMALLAVLLPWSRISVLFWSGFFVIPVRIPVLLVVSWYIYWDYHYAKLYGAATTIGHIAHLSGAAGGIMVGLLCRLFLKKEIQRRARAVKGLL